LAGAEAGRIHLLKATWNEIFLKEFDTFPGAKHDDQVDCASIAWDKLVGREFLSPTWGRSSNLSQSSLARGTQGLNPHMRSRALVKGAVWGRSRPGQIFKPKNANLQFQVK